MIALINAAYDYQQAFDEAVRIISAYNKQASKGEITVVEALYQIDLTVRHVGLLVHPIDSSKIIALEQAHFKANARRNEHAARNKAAQRQPSLQRRKQNLGIAVEFLQVTPERTTAPNSMERPGKLLGSIYDEVNRTGPRPIPDEPLTGQGQVYSMDPSLTEDDDINPEDLVPGEPKKQTPVKSSLTKSTMAEIDRIMQEMVPEPKAEPVAEPKPEPEPGKPGGE
jgi:hypothetical protein